MRRTAIDCRSVREALEEYFEGVLPARRCEQVASHLASCPACAAELRQIEKMAAALEAAPRVVPAEDLVRLVSMRVAELPAPGQRRALVLGFRRVGVLAACLLGLLAGVSYLLRSVLSQNEVLLGPTVIWAKGSMSQLIDWLVAVASLGASIWQAAVDIGGALLLAAKASLPAVGLYAAGEIGILLALILVFHLGRRKTLAQHTLLI